MAALRKSCVALFLITLCVALTGTDRALGRAGPTCKVRIGPIGNPPDKNWVRVDGDWKDCGGATDAEIVLYKGTNKMKAFAVNVGQLTANPAGAAGKLGGDMSDQTKYKTGDTVFAIIRIKNGNKVITDNETNDFLVP
jgi:hypothetical protein